MHKVSKVKKKVWVIWDLHAFNIPIISHNIHKDTKMEGLHPTTIYIHYLDNFITKIKPFCTELEELYKLYISAFKAYRHPL